MLQKSHDSCVLEAKAKDKNVTIRVNLSEIYILNENEGSNEKLAVVPQVLCNRSCHALGALR